MGMMSPAAPLLLNQVHLTFPRIDNSCYVDDSKGQGIHMIVICTKYMEASIPGEVVAVHDGDS
jgi:hypothetical protein